MEYAKHAKIFSKLKDPTGVSNKYCLFLFLLLNYYISFLHTFQNRNQHYFPC